jgi:hypothetical protein
MFLSTFFMRLLPRAESYAPQTKILEGLTKDEIHIFDVLFNGSYPKYSTHALKKCVENPNFLFCQSFQNLRLGGIKVRLFLIATMPATALLAFLVATCFFRHACRCNLLLLADTGYTGRVTQWRLALTRDKRSVRTR